MRDIAARPADPVTYADRVRPVDPADPAVVLDSRTLSNAELVDLLGALRDRYSLTYESRSAAVARGGIDGAGAQALALEQLLVTATGAVVVLVPEGIVGGEDLDGVLYNEWVTHAHLPASSLETLEPGLEDLAVVVVVDEAPAGVLTEWRSAHQVHVAADQH